MCGHLCEDFTIASEIDEEAIVRLERWFKTQAEDTLQKSGTTLFEVCNLELGPVEQEAIVIGLIKCEGARRVNIGDSLVDSTYIFEINRCIDVLHQQRIGARALEAEGHPHTEQTSVEILATLPPEMDTSQLAGTEIYPLQSRLRRILLEARESARIANPYFDSGELVVDDLIALPRAGVETRILTREVADDSHRRTFNRMYDALDADSLGYLNLRELYELDDGGRQTTATHAKVMVIDETIAYVGSANLTATSLYSNFEVGVLLSGPPVAAICSVFDRIFAAARSVTLPVE